LNFKYYYNTLNLKQKIQLYLIPLLIGVFVYFNIPKSAISNTKIIPTKSIKIIKTKPNQLEILKILQTLEKQLDIQIFNYTFQNDKLKLQLETKYIKGIKFLYLIETISIIENLNLYYKNHMLYLSMILNFIPTTKKQNFDTIHLDTNIANSFILSKEIVNNTLKSKAIIGDYLILNGKWYKVGDKYKQYTITKIEQKYIELKYKNSITTMEIFDEQEYK